MDEDKPPSCRLGSKLQILAVIGLIGILVGLAMAGVADAARTHDSVPGVQWLGFSLMGLVAVVGLTGAVLERKMVRR